MRRGMCITYEVEGALYLNITNKCSNRCDFCIRNNGDSAYGSEPLWLLREPTEKEILDSVFARDLTAYSEIVFCGYGEPTYRLDTLLSVARAIKARFPDMKIRVNTNGHADLISGKPTASLFEGAVDTLSVSLNSPTPEGYDAICHSVYGTAAHAALIKFATEAKRYAEVIFSVVRESLTDSELLECKRLADKAGVFLKIRDYIPPEK